MPFSHEDCLAAKDMIQSGLTKHNNFPPNTFQFIELCKIARNRRIDNIPKLEDKTVYSTQEFAEKHLKKIKEIINKARFENKKKSPSETEINKVLDDRQRAQDMRKEL